MSSNSGCARADGRRTAGIAALGVLALGACQEPIATRERVITVFGTIVRVEVAGGEAQQTDAALDALENLYRELDVEWRSFGPGELGRVNGRLAQGQPAELSDRLREMVRRSLEIHELSAGLFDPRIGPLVALWGFQDLAQGSPAAPPAPAAIDTARSAISAARLHLDGNRLRADAPVTLELAGIAKGSALAAGARLLQARGIKAALIVAGGDVVAIGRRGDRPWMVGVRDPLAPGVLGAIALAPGEAIASSGTYERNFRAGARVFHHLIDPRTGYPATGTAGTTVVANDAELANAGAAALLIGGEKRFAELTARMGLATALLVTADGRLLTTAGMSQRIEKL